MSKYEADLHTHTLASDGTEPPAVNVRLAKEAGLSAMAITDHDTVSGLEEAQMEGARLGIEIVPGVEISTIAGNQDIHVLGYYIDDKDPLFLERLASLRETRNRRNELMIERLQKLGYAITLDEVHKEVEDVKSEGDTIGRPHVAAVLLKKGYVASINEAFEQLLGKNGKAYVNPPRIDPATAIQWIHEAGGAAVLAHPGIYGDDPLVESILQDGLDGIEVYHSDHTPEDEAKYLAMAQRNQLLVTAGSDFHGERGGVVFHAPIGSRRVNIAVLDELREKRGKQN
jgi:predicted metal-dependent phosphoesterase TrpH